MGKISNFVKGFYGGEQKMSNGLTKQIFEIAEKIPEDYSVATLSDFKEVVDGITKYRLMKGYATTSSLLDHRHVSIAVTTIPDGGKFQEHVHRIEKEMLIILEGRLRMSINKKSKIYKEGSLITINKNVKHDATAIGDAVIVALTIPRDEGFPK